MENSFPPRPTRCCTKSAGSCENNRIRIATAIIGKAREISTTSATPASKQRLAGETLHLLVDGESGLSSRAGSPSREASALCALRGTRFQGTEEGNEERASSRSRRPST